MWPEPQKNGKVKFIERYVNPMTGKTGRVSITMDKDTRSTRKEAARILEEKINDRLKLPTAGSRSDPSKFTLRDLVDAYRIEQEKTVKASTYRRNYFTASSMLNVLGGDTLVSKLSAPYIRDKMFSLDASNASINELLKRSKGILRWGYDNDYIDDISFLDKVKPLPDITYREKIEDKYLETKDFIKLIKGMDVPVWKLLSKFLGLSGLRVGEAIALNRSDVDFKNRLIHVTKTYDANNGIETTPKTPSSHRDVYMQDELYEVCREISFCMLKQGLINGYGKSPLFFQNKEGGHIKYYAYNKYVKENAKRILGLEKITPHIFRHTHTCMLAENGVMLETISRRLGHEDSRITKDVYSHITDKILQNDFEQVAKIQIL